MTDPNLTPLSKRQRERYDALHTELRVVAFAAIKDVVTLEKRLPPAQGRIRCPLCTDGVVRWVIAQSNGHLHAVCSTAGCLSMHE